MLPVRLLICRVAAVAVTLVPLAPSASGQGSDIPPGYRGTESSIARGILDGNLIETNFRNQGELSRYNDLPWGVWPRGGNGGRHIDGVGVMIAGQVPGERSDYSDFYNTGRDTTLNPVVLNYRDAGLRIGPDGGIWGWLPLPGFHNPNRVDPITGARNPTPALSDDPTSWPSFWPDRLDNPDDPGWAGFWDGFFGKGVFNADLEGFYVIDDLSDLEYSVDPETGLPYSPYGVFTPVPGDFSVGGLGVQTKVRIFQWANVLSEDIMFLLYRITNVGDYDHQRLYFAQAQDYGLGTEEGDESAAFDPLLDVAYGWDQTGFCTAITGGEYECGYTGFAFLESPTLQSDGLDNDQDGMTDELRFGGAGSLIEGQAQILAAASASYNVAAFEAAYGPLEERPAYLAGRWWTGDENLDWVGYDDANGNGQFDAGESVNDDTGRDGLGPFDLGYPGPDDGEADGLPTPGEPNFDELDVDESDQVGLTGFDLGTRPFYENGDNLRSDTWLFDRIINYAQFELGTEGVAELVADIEPFLLFVSGPVPLAPDDATFFSTAWIFGADEADFFKNRRTAQNIYNADYSFAQPPFTPTLTAIPGDGRVVLSWDTLALSSFDRFSQEKDFEGFRLYKGTDPILTDARSITDVNGTPTFYRPIAQWDLKNGIQGNVPVLEGSASYNLGSDNGVQFFYVDEDVTNGLTYYYALVAYDRGFSDPDNPSAPPIDPQENTFNFSVTQGGLLTGLSQNAAVVTPRTPSAGYIDGGAREDLSRVAQGLGTGSGSVEVLDDSDLDPDGVYRITFFSDFQPNSEFYETTSYSLTDITSGETLLDRVRISEVTPYIDGFVFKINNPREAALDRSRTGYRGTEDGQPAFALDPARLDDVATDWVATVRADSTTLGFASPWDYQLRWVNEADSLYQPPRSIGFLRTPIPVYAVNASLNETVDLLPLDVDGDGAFGAGDELVIAEAARVGGGRRYRYRVAFDGSADAAPAPGTVFQIGSTRPFFEGDFFQFSVRSSEIDRDLAQEEMNRIAVVPNPYIGTSIFEPRTQIEGRGDRRVQFIHLPQTCTIRIFTLRGELVRTLQHDGLASDGAETWDLRTDGNENVAYGMYIYHVEAPGIGEYIGKLALVK